MAPSAASLTHNSILGLSTLGWLASSSCGFSSSSFFSAAWSDSPLHRFLRPGGLCRDVRARDLDALAGGFSSLSLQLPAGTSNVATLGVMANAAMLIVAYFAALLLNFGDFARFGKDEAAMKTGNLLGLPVNFLVFSIITVIVTAGTLKVFGEAMMDPVMIVEKIGNPIVVDHRFDHLHRRDDGHQHRCELRLASLRHLESQAGKDQLQDGRPDHLHPVGAGLPWLFVASPSAITLFVSIFGSVWGRCSESWWPTTIGEERST